MLEDNALFPRNYKRGDIKLGDCLVQNRSVVVDVALTFGGPAQKVGSQRIRGWLLAWQKLRA